MIDLPRDLRPWSALLDLFAPDVAEGLGPLLPRLAITIGPMRISRPTGDGEPDGFTGIARRGSYERLLLTEWLLADEAPLEFARRAATGEHAFFHLARRTPARALNSVALFDAGPDQLGAPRVAHLAALLVLAARAERAGARFAWGLLHEPDRALFAAVTKESVLRLLGGRTAIGAGAADVAAWAERGAKSGWDDAWIVGAQTIVPGWKYGTVEVRDLYDPARRALAITARASTAATREAELPLPPDRVTAMLLSNPFAAPTLRPAPAPGPSPVHSGPIPISNLVFAPNGSKVFSRAETGEVIAYPTSGGRPKRYRPRAAGVVAAVGWVSRGCVMLVIEERGLVLEHTARDTSTLLNRRIPLRDGHPIVAPQIHDPLSPLIHQGFDAEAVYFADARRTLHGARRERRSDAEPIILRIAFEVAAMDSVARRLCFVGRYLGAPGNDDTLILDKGGGATRRHREDAWHLVEGWQADPPFTEALDGDGTFEARFGHAMRSASALVAVQQRADLWTIHHGKSMVADLAPPEGAQVIGPFRAGPTSETPPSLIVLEADRRTISRIGRAEARVLERAASPIADAVISTSIPAVAYVTLAGETVIRSLVTDGYLGRFEPKDVR